MRSPTSSRPWSSASHDGEAPIQRTSTIWAPTAPAAFLTFAEYPAYRLYELAPRVGEIAARSDQQLAGLLMKAIADPIMWLGMGILFFRWSARERAEDAAEMVAPPPRSR